MIRCLALFRATFHSAKLINDYLFGVNSVIAALQANRRHFDSLYVAHHKTHQQSPRLLTCISLCRDKGIPIHTVDREKLDRMLHRQGAQMKAAQTPSRVHNKDLPQPKHQDIILSCSALQFTESSETCDPNCSPPLGLSIFFDKINDPQNFGAILRTCLFFGVQRVYVPSKGACPLTPAVSRVSAGAMEYIQVEQVDKWENFFSRWGGATRILQETSTNNQSAIISTGVENGERNKGLTPKSISMTELSVLRKNWRSSLLLIGSQGSGVALHLRRKAHFEVTVGSIGPKTQVDSLNVGAATACLLYELTKPSNDKIEK